MLRYTIHRRWKAIRYIGHPYEARKTLTSGEVDQCRWSSPYSTLKKVLNATGFICWRAVELFADIVILYQRVFAAFFHLDALIPLKQRLYMEKKVFDCYN